VVEGVGGDRGAGAVVVSARGGGAHGLLSFVDRLAGLERNRRPSASGLQDKSKHLQYCAPVRARPGQRVLLSARPRRPMMRSSVETEMR